MPVPQILPFLSTSLLVPLLIPISVFFGYLLYCLAFVARKERASRADRFAASSRRCRYCHWGVARIQEEIVKFDGEDIVETRRFVCLRCGLPQWHVNRTPVLPRVPR